MTGQPFVHLVGSIPLEDAESVFRKLGDKLEGCLHTIPDGETGRRKRWISFINDQLKENPGLEVDPDLPPFQFKQYDGKVVFEIERLRYKSGVDPATVKFATGYADDALRNYETFKRLRDEGAIPAGVKYQICMATPLAIAYNFISMSAYGDFIPAYTQHLKDEVMRIADALPHDDIAYQWDVCQEVLMWEDYYDQPPHHEQQIMAVLGEIGDFVPTTIDLGYHLCYGSPADEHMVIPEDMSVLVAIANGIGGSVSRPIKYIHMPVIKERSDDAYFAPLAGLKLPAGTSLYLGLVHEGDDVNNAAKLVAAQKHVEVTAISAECGLGRGKPELFDNVLEEHRRLAAAG